MVRIPNRTRLKWTQTVSDGSVVGRIDIPRLGISEMILQGIDSKTLRFGVGHIDSSALPGARGNVALAAHRDTFFRPLRKIHVGDLVTVATFDGTYDYKVDWFRAVRPEDTTALAASKEPVLTLITCYPFYFVGAAPERFVVRAHPVPSVGIP